MRAIWETNVFGVLAVYQAMLPLLRESTDARIVNVSSGVGSLTSAMDPSNGYRTMFSPGYSASKTAFNAVTVAMMVELENTGIKVNLVSPGSRRPTSTTTRASSRWKRDRARSYGSRCWVPTDRPVRSRAGRTRRSPGDPEADQAAGGTFAR